MVIVFALVVLASTITSVRFNMCVYDAASSCMHDADAGLAKPPPSPPSLSPSTFGEMASVCDPDSMTEEELMACSLGLFLAAIKEGECTYEDSVGDGEGDPIVCFDCTVQGLVARCGRVATSTVNAVFIPLGVSRLRSVHAFPPVAVPGHLSAHRHCGPRDLCPADPRARQAPQRPRHSWQPVLRLLLHSLLHQPLLQREGMSLHTSKMLE